MAASTSPPPDNEATRGPVRRGFARLVDLWDSAQVELHGRYSVKRMKTLHGYRDKTTKTRVALVMFLTPLPCLAAVAFADCIPLSPPSQGLSHSTGFWFRAIFATWVYAFSVMEQLRYFVPRLPLTGYTTFALSIPVTVATNVVTYLLAWIFGFPLPFTIPALSIPYSTFMFMALWLQLRQYFQVNPQILREVLQFLLVAVCQMSLVLIYPAYNSVFYNLSSKQQTLFALLLPVIKLIEKNCISMALRHGDDRKPEMIIFNVEVFNALFVACCLQNSNSMVTNIVLVAVDFIQACISLRDLDIMLLDVKVLALKLNIDKDQFIETAIQISKENPHMEDRVSTLILKERLEMSRSRRTLAQRMRRMTASVSYLLSGRQPLVPIGAGSMRIAPLPIDPTAARGGKEEQQASKYEQELQTPVLTAPALSEACATTVPLQSGTGSTKAKGSTTSSPVAKSGGGPLNQHRPVSIVDRMDDNERLRFLQKILQTLHMTEYLLLIEYAEVMIPIVYSIYLIVLFHLPNRMYYPQLRHMDEQKLQQTISNVMTNAILELISLILLAIVLRKKFLSSPFRQLSFVLDCQWPMVQSKVILWVVVTLQSTLDHLGADYSFKFEWLHHNQTMTG